MVDDVLGCFAVIGSTYPEFSGTLDSVVERLRVALAHQPLCLGRIHGDFAPANVLWVRDFRQVTGIVDWELCADRRPPETDLAHFVLAYISETTNREYGAVVRDLLTGDYPNDLEPIVALLADGPNRWPIRRAVLLGWAGHIAANLTKSDSHGSNPLWRRANVEVVVDALARTGATGTL
jgi:hypothetical protein